MHIHIFMSLCCTLCVTLYAMKVLYPGVHSTCHGPTWAMMGYFWIQLGGITCPMLLV